MKKPLTLLAIVAFMAFLTATLFSVWAAKPSNTIAVEVTFRDAPGDGIRSDGGGVYIHGVDQVRAEITNADGRLQFAACSSSAKSKTSCPDSGTRVLFYDFSELADDILGPSAFPGMGSVGLPFQLDSFGFSDGNMGVRVRDMNGDPLPEGLLGMVEGETRLATMKSNFNFRDGGLIYTVRFRPANEPDSHWVLVTRLEGEVACSETTACAEWTVEALTGTFPDPTGGACCPTTQLHDIATLLSDNTNDEGDYHLPFQITIRTLAQSDDDGGSGGGGGKGKGKP